MPHNKYAPEPELYGILGDKDAYRQLEHLHDPESRYPSFHQPEASTSSPSHKPASEDRLHSDSAKAKARRSRQPGMEENARPTYLSPQQTGATDLLSAPGGGGSSGSSWYDQDVEPPKISKATSRLTRKPLAPSRPAPAPAADYSTPTSFASPAQSGLAMSEPVQPFAKPRKSALKSSNVGSSTMGSSAPSGLSSAPSDAIASWAASQQSGPPQPSPLPATAYLSPATAQKRRMELRGHAGPPPSAMRPPSREAQTSYWQSPAPSHGRLSSTGGSHRGSSAATSSVAFTSSSFSNSNSNNYSSYGSTSASNTSPFIPDDDGEPYEAVPRSTLYVVNADPTASESEQSLPLPSRGGPRPPGKPTGLSRRLKGLSAPADVPPVPRVPPQFQAPPPPSFPPPSNNDRSHSDPSVPVLHNGQRDRGILKRNNSDSVSGRATQPRPLTSPPRDLRPSSAQRSLGRSESNSSNGSSPSPHTPPTQPVLQADIPPEWVHPLPLTLEQLFRGGKHEFRITRHMLDGSKKDTTVLVDVQPGWKSGTRITFPGAGNERTPGQYQDVIFVVEQIHHERFARLDGGRLVVTEEISLPDALTPGRKLHTRRIVGLDGKVIEFVAPSVIIKNGLETVVKGHGMYIRSKSQIAGRGDLVIRWSVRVPNDITPSQYERMREIFSK
ncbi:hypothetical protein FRB95_011860 [Tulasnella sp. JGI-2019a]|nr:hypothetical protein FRB95_011860 [Tulasnella sp. JGI-2019a]